jgi:bifunctional DNA-binding transcriptional regulator/antitoxin component of YhaV-PrlF toxin-antitoxin module
MAGSYHIAKLYRQANSLVMVVPKPVTIALGLKRGDHILLQWNQTDGNFEFKKFVLAGGKDVDSREHTDSEGRSGATQAKVGGGR